MALARSVIAQTVVAAVVQLSTSLERAVMARPSRLAVARVCIAVTLAVTGAAVGAILTSTCGAREVGGTEAGAVEALATRLIAATRARTNRAVQAIKAVVAATLLGPLIAHSVTRASVGAEINLGLTLDTHKAGGAQAVTRATLASVDFAVLGALLLTASRALPASLAQACCVISAVTIHAVRADGLRAINTSVAHITLALAGDAVATTVTRATVGAHLLLTRLAHKA